MIRYTKEYIRQLLDRFMNGETTVEEEDVLGEYFQQTEVPEEWRDYQMMFAEWQPELKPTRRWHWFTAAAAAVLLVVMYVAVSQRQPEVSGLSIALETPQDTTTITPVSTPDTVAAPAEKPKSLPQRRREPRVNDVARDYALRAQAEQQRVEQEIAAAQAEVERVQLEVLDAQLRAQGYVMLKHEDGTIEYRKENEQNEYYAYEPD